MITNKLKINDTKTEFIVCCMKNDAGNVVSDADGMKNIWKKYIEKLLNVENDWDGEVDCPEVMGPIVSFRKKRLQQLL